MGVPELIAMPPPVAAELSSGGDVGDRRRSPVRDPAAETAGDARSRVATEGGVGDRELP